MSTHQEPMNFGNEQRISPRVYHLAQIIYHEFEVMRRVFGESAYKTLVPIVIGILEEMDLLTVDKQKLDLDFNLLTAEKNDISVQLCRQKELYTAAKRVCFNTVYSHSACLFSIFIVWKMNCLV